MAFKKTVLTLGLLGLIYPVTAEAYDLTINQRYVELLSKVYGYCLGQALTAERIQDEFPELDWPMKRATSLFHNGTRQACQETVEVLQAALGEKFVTLRATTGEQLNDLLISQPISRDQASQFVAEVERRAVWEIPSPFLEELLSVTYRDEPVAELLAGHAQSFSTLDHPKSLGIDATIELPLSWGAAEGKRPHIIQKWVSQVGFGMSSVMLVADEINGISITAPMLEQMVGIEDPLDFEGDGGFFRGASTFTHETLPAITYNYDMRVQRAEFTASTRLKMHQIFLQDRVVNLMCQTAGPSEQQAAINAEFEAMEPLCQLALNSLVLNDVYK